jgi:hypothetical protein
VQEDILGRRDITDNGKVDGASRVRSLPIAQWHDQLWAKSSTNASFVFSQMHKTKSHKVVSPTKSHGTSARLTVALQEGRETSRIRKNSELILCAQREDGGGLLGRGIHRFGLCLLARAATRGFMRASRVVLV